MTGKDAGSALQPTTTAEGLLQSSPTSAELFKGGIRFVNANSSGAPAPSRISLACLTCRSRKVRCDGHRPCSACVASHRECVFNTEKSRKRRKVSREAAANSILLSEPPPRDKANPPKRQISDSQQSAGAGDSNGADEDMTSHVPPSPLAADAQSAPRRTAAKDAEAESNKPPIRVPYFRYLGPTAIAPGAPFRQIHLQLRSGGKGHPPFKHSEVGSVIKPARRPSLSSPYRSTGPSTAASRSPTPSPLNTEHCQRCLDIFYDRMESFLPYIRKADLMERVADGTASEALMCAIAAVAETVHRESPDNVNVELYSSRAKRLIIPHLSLPTLDTIFTLLLLAYTEFARDLDSGLWMFTGMAIRMCIDMGLHKPFVGDQVTGHRLCDTDRTLRLRVFWCVLQLDRFISSGTGRVTTIRENEVEVEFPPPEVVTLLVASSPTPHELLAPFPYLARLAMLLGRVSDHFNGRTARTSRDAGAGQCLRSPDSMDEQSRGPSPQSQWSEDDEAVRGLRSDLANFHAQLPQILHFNVANARHYTLAKKGQAFLLLHLWFHALVLMTHNPHSVGLKWVLPADGAAADAQSMELARSSARSISDMIAFADLIEPGVWTNSPFTSQPIFMAACASVPQAQPALPPGAPPHHSRSLLDTVDQRNFDMCAAALKKMRPSWRGVSWLINTLESRASFEPDVDLTREEGTQINTRDRSLWNKLSSREHDGARELLKMAGLEGTDNTEVFGFSASGTFNEPASGTLSFLQRSDVSGPASGPDLGWATEHRPPTLPFPIGSGGGGGNRPPTFPGDPPSDASLSSGSSGGGAWYPSRNSQAPPAPSSSASQWSPPGPYGGPAEPSGASAQRRGRRQREERAMAAEPAAGLPGDDYRGSAPDVDLGPLRGELWQDLFQSDSGVWSSFSL